MQTELGAGDGACEGVGLIDLKEQLVAGLPDAEGAVQLQGDTELQRYVRRAQHPEAQASSHRAAFHGGDRVERDVRLPPQADTQLLDGASIYWTVGPAVFPGGEVGFGRLYRVPKDGSTPATVLVDGLSEPAGMFVDGPFLYWSEYASGAARGRVMRTLKPL